MTDRQPEAPTRYRLAIRRPVTTAMIFLTLIVFGVRSYQQLPINLMPDIDYPTLTVRTEYEGAAPEVVENLVTRPLEEMLSIVSGMVELSSVSSPGISEIVLEFTWGTDMNIAQQDVRDRLDLFEAPQELTEKPVILRFDPTLDPVMQVAISAPPGSTGDAAVERELLTQIREATERHLKSDLEAKAGIAQVLVKGGQEAEIQVLVDPQRAKDLGISMELLGSSLAQQNISRSSGSLKEGKSEYLVRTFNEFESIDDIRESLITTVTGRPIRLGDVADVFMGTKERETVVRVNGREAVGLEIYKEGDANTVQVCNLVKDLLGFERDLGFFETMKQRAEERIQKASPADGAPDNRPVRLADITLMDELPEGVEVTLISDQSRFIQGSIDEVKNATIVGGVLALAVLFVFLRELKSTAIIGFAIPISVIATFVPLFMRDISLNIMSLGGLALGVGMLVDNSIVVLESIFRCREEGDSPVDAAERGTREVSSAVTASTLTTVCVFLPIAFVEGIAGQLFGDMALTVTFSLLASLLTSLYLIPLVVSRSGITPVHGGRHVFWGQRAYEELRGEGRFGRAGALARIVPRGIGYSGTFVREKTRQSLVPITALRGQWARGGLFLKLPAGALILLALPLVVALLVCQLLLGALATVAITALFAVCLIVLGIYTGIRKVMQVILWLPMRFFDLGYNATRRLYGSFLQFALPFSPVIVLLVLGIAVHAGYTMAELGGELIPPMKQGEFTIRLEAKAGTRIEETELRAREFDEIIRANPNVDRVTVEVGEESTRGTTERGENVAEFTVLLKDPKRLALVQDSIIETLRGDLPIAPSEEVTFQLPSLFSFKTAIELNIIGDELPALRALGESALAMVEDVPGVIDADLSIKPGYPEIIITPDRQLLASKGLSTADVASRIQSELQGDVPTRYSSLGDKIDIRVRASKDFLESKRELVQLNLGQGLSVPLSSVTNIQQMEGPSEIRRVGQRRTVVVSANIEGRDLAAVSSDILNTVERLERPQGYFFELGGQNRELETSYASLKFALLLAIFLVYVVMACQFESIWHPALVMFSVPLAFIGVIYALDWMNIDLSIMVFIGGIILAGIVVNNAIVLVDYINHLRRRGLSKSAAVVEASTVRLRPILMTTITTVLGLLPMIVASGEGAEMRRPMAVTLMSGLTSATLLTLLIIPMVYYMFGGRDTAPARELVESS